MRRRPRLLARLAGRIADSGAPGRWETLKRWAAPVLSPPALAAAVPLVLLLVLGAILQFGTSLFAAFPGLSQAFALLSALLAAVVAAIVALRRPFLRSHAAAVLVLAGVLALSLWSLAAKGAYQRGLAGNPFYTLPHAPAGYPAEAARVAIRTADGVTLTGTYLPGGHIRAIVLYPGWRTDRQSFAVASLAQWLSPHYDVLALDPRGQGESGGMKTPDGAAKQDLLAAVSYLHGNGHMKVGVLAEQDGALPAMLAAAEGRGVDALAISDPTLAWGEGLGATGKLFDPRGLPGRLYWRVVAGLRLGAAGEALPTTDAIRMVAPVPLLLTATRGRPGSPADLLYEHARDPKSLIVLGGTGRPVDWPHFATYYETVKDWFALALR